MRRIATCGIILVTAIHLSCRRHDTAAPTTRPATAPTTRIATTTTAPASQRTPSALMMDGKRYDFPPARITIVPKSSGLSLDLFSDEPPKGQADRANSFYFQMSLSIEDPDDLPSAKWHYKADSDFPDDLPDGIFLNDGGTQIQPIDIDATFERDGDAIVVSLNGTFVDFGAEETGDGPRKFQVAGKLSATPE